MLDKLSVAFLIRLRIYTSQNSNHTPKNSLPEISPRPLAWVLRRLHKIIFYHRDSFNKMILHSCTYVLNSIMTVHL